MIRRSSLLGTGGPGHIRLTPHPESAHVAAPFGDAAVLEAQDFSRVKRWRTIVWEKDADLVAVSK